MSSSLIRIAVDSVVFGYSKTDGISLLLIKRKYDPFKDSWALPGGFVKNGESLEQAVQRELLEESGIKVNFLEQLFTFGNPDRDPRQHVVSVSYFGLVKTAKFKKLKASTDAERASWFQFDQLPKLAFDHTQIVKLAIERLRSKLSYQPIGFELLDKKFPFSDLEKLYEDIIGKPIDRRNFKKKIMGFGILEKLDEKAPKTGAGRPGNLFQFNKNEYNRLVKSGIYFEV